MCPFWCDALGGEDKTCKRCSRSVHMPRMTKALQKKRATEKSAAQKGAMSFFWYVLLLELKHGAGGLRPTVLCHIFAVKFRFSRFQMAEIITL